MFIALRAPDLVCVAFTAAFLLPLGPCVLFAFSSIHALALSLFSRLSVSSLATSFAVLFLPVVVSVTKEAWRFVTLHGRHRFETGKKTEL